VLFVDVDVVLGAIRPDQGPEAEALFVWLEAALGGYEPVGVSELVLSAAVRIATHPRAYATPFTPEQALTSAEAIRDAPAAMLVQPGARHWGLFRGLVAGLRLRGSDVADAYLAAMAWEQGATMVTRDRGFRRFEGLRLLDPLAPSG
jgi:toxin-antitoxin system PIN domain toxin